MLLAGVTAHAASSTSSPALHGFAGLQTASAASSVTPRGTSPSASTLRPSAARRFAPGLGAITEAINEGQAEGEAAEEAWSDDDDRPSDATWQAEGAEGTEGGDEAPSLGKLVEATHAAGTADALLEVITAIEGLVAVDDGAPPPHHESARIYISALNTARERLGELQVAEARSLASLGCLLPSDILAGGGRGDGLGGGLGGAAPPRAHVSAHVILVVDCSGSMRNADVAASAAEDGAPAALISRASAVLGLLTHNFLRTQLEGGAVASERVSLIRIQGASTVSRMLPFALMPLDATLSERITTSLGEPASHGPYLPALGLVAKLVELCAPQLLPRAKTSVLFLSDGRPSDRVDERELPARLEVLPLLPWPSMAFHGLPWPSKAFHRLPPPSTAFHRLPPPSTSFAACRCSPMTSRALLPSMAFQRLSLLPWPPLPADGAPPRLRGLQPHEQLPRVLPAAWIRRGGRGGAAPDGEGDAGQRGFVQRRQRPGQLSIARPVRLHLCLLGRRFSHLLRLPHRRPAPRVAQRPPRAGPARSLPRNQGRPAASLETSPMLLPCYSRDLPRPRSTCRRLGSATLCLPDLP